PSPPRPCHPPPPPRSAADRRQAPAALPPGGAPGGSRERSRTTPPARSRRRRDTRPGPDPGSAPPGRAGRGRHDRPERGRRRRGQVNAKLSKKLPLFALLLAGCTNPADGGRSATPAAAPAADTILVGEYGSLTGSEATFGQSTHNGVLLATSEQNGKGGFKGK